MALSGGWIDKHVQSLGNHEFPSADLLREHLIRILGRFTFISYCFISYNFHHGVPGDS